MLVQIKGSKKIQAEAIFLQPTRYCAMNCKGCYVKAHQVIQQTPFSEQKKLLKALCDPEKVEVGQITMSVDTLPDFNNISKNHERNHLGKIFEAFIDQAIASQTKTEFHITVHNAGTLQNYIAMKEMPERVLGSLDFISLSKPVVSNRSGFERFRKRIPSTKFGWNMMFPWKTMNKDRIIATLEYIRKAEPLLDQIYLLLTKSPVGATRTLETAEADREQMKTNLYFIEQVQKMAERNGFAHKLLVDGCLRDVVKFKDTGFGCSANVSKFQIWPDGSVSGCPYKHKAVTPAADFWEDVLENIRKARDHYDFQECHLPEIHEDVTRVL